MVKPAARVHAGMLFLAVCLQMEAAASAAGTFSTNTQRLRRAAVSLC